MIKKILFVLFIIFFFLLFVFLGAAVIYSQQKNISIIEELKIDSKKIILQIKDIIYYQATVHNPEGNLMPDEVDDTILGRIKSLI